MFQKLFSSRPARGWKGAAACYTVAASVHAVLLSLLLWAGRTGRPGEGGAVFAGSLGSGEPEPVTYLILPADRVRIEPPADSRKRVSRSGSRPVEVTVRERGATVRETAGAEVEGLTSPGVLALLSPRVADPRLALSALEPSAEPVLTPANRAAVLNVRLRRLLAEANDSAEAAGRREAAALDWTVRDGGRKWGISLGRIHLGGITLPLPFTLGDPRRAEERLRSYDEIRRQGDQGGIDATFEERVKAIRERREAERRNSKEPLPADSSRGALPPDSRPQGD